MKNSGEKLILQVVEQVIILIVVFHSDSVSLNPVLAGGTVCKWAVLPLFLINVLPPSLMSKVWLNSGRIPQPTDVNLGFESCSTS
jgi:hypothetical protein